VDGKLRIIIRSQRHLRGDIDFPGLSGARCLKNSSLRRAPELEARQKRLAPPSSRLYQEQVRRVSGGSESMCCQEQATLHKRFGLFNSSPTTESSRGLDDCCQSQLIKSRDPVSGPYSRMVHGLDVCRSSRGVISDQEQVAAHGGAWGKQSLFVLGWLIEQRVSVGTLFSV
jgi:hypothetical protein